MGIKAILLLALIVLVIWSTQDLRSLFVCRILHQVACNSLLLAEESVFFTAKFSNPDFGGSSRLVELQDVDGDTLETVVAALLTATIKLDRENIEPILHCADMLQVSPS